jgi:ABC-type branched-subunit amino acid transport system ATPase component
MTQNQHPQPPDSASAGAAVLLAEEITVRFGGLTAVSSVSLAVPAGAIIGLIGPNGAGKTTLLGVVSGSIRPAAGRVRFMSKDITDYSVNRRARSGMARTFQHCELFSGLTVRDHLVVAWRRAFAPRRIWLDLLDGRAWRKPPSVESERVDYLLGILGLDSLADAPVTTLSFGLSKLVEIGRALASRPQLLMLDEPFAGLDAHESEQVAAALTDIVACEGVAVLLVDHDVDTVLARSKEVYVLDAGQLIASGTPAEVRDNAEVRRAYLGDNFAAAVVA